MDNLLEEQLTKHYNTIWKQVEYITNNVPRSALDIVIDKKTIFFRLYHILETAEFYLQENPNDMKWGDHIGIDYEKTKTEDSIAKMKNYTNDQLLAYLNDVKDETGSKFKEAAYSDKSDFKWLDNNLDKYFYLMRHCNWHLGEIYSLLKGKGILINWR